jgi:formyl-CoA transferase
VYKTRDGYMNIAASGHKIWLRLCEAIGAPELAAHPDYATGAARSKHRDALHAELEQRLRAQDSAHWIDVLNQAGVPSGPIYAIDEAFADPQTQALGIVQKVDDVAYLGQPVTLSRTPSQVVSHPPALGEHTTEILRDLGCDAAEIDQLAARGII